MGLFNVNINSDQINQYQYKEINDGKSLEISKNGKPIGNVAAHRTLIHRGQMDEVKTITGKKFYIKHNDFTAAITPSSVNIQNKDQTTAAHNNNNNNNQSDQIRLKTRWLIIRKRPQLNQKRLKTNRLSVNQPF